MGVTCGFYNSINSDRKYDAEQLSSIFDGVISDGVFEKIGTALAITANSGMNINIGVGRAWFNKTWTDNDSVFSLTVEQSEAILNRIDTVILEVNKDDAVRENNIGILKGTPASSPVAPTLTNTELIHQYPLANIYVGAGVTTITSGNITNKIGTEACPYADLRTTMDISSDEYKGQTNYNQMDIGTDGNCRLDTSGGDFRIYTSNKASDATGLMLFQSGGGRLTLDNNDLLYISYSGRVTATNGYAKLGKYSGFTWTGTIANGGQQYIAHNFGYVPIVTVLGTTGNLQITIESIDSNTIRVVVYSSGGNSFSGTIYCR